MARGKMFPFVLAGLFGIMNGIYVFKPALEEHAQWKLENDLKPKEDAGDVVETKTETPEALEGVEKKV